MGSHPVTTNFSLSLELAEHIQLTWPLLPVLQLFLTIFMATESLEFWGWKLFLPSSIFCLSLEWPPRNILILSTTQRQKFLSLQAASGNHHTLSSTGFITPKSEVYNSSHATALNMWRKYQLIHVTCLCQLTVQNNAGLLWRLCLISRGC